MKRNDMHTVHIPTVIAACCILHNICEIHGECFNDAWLLSESEFEQPTSTSLPSASTGNAKDVRNTIMLYLYSQQ